MLPEIRTPFKIRRWYDRFYTSKLELNEAAMKGLIVRAQQHTQYGTWYSFATLKGEFIARFYKDACFGFCSQAYGMQLPANIYDII